MLSCWTIWINYMNSQSICDSLRKEQEASRKCRPSLRTHHWHPEPSIVVAFWLRQKAPLQWKLAPPVGDSLFLSRWTIWLHQSFRTLCSFIRHTNCGVNTQLITVLVWLCLGRTVGQLCQKTKWCCVRDLLMHWAGVEYESWWMWSIYPVNKAFMLEKQNSHGGNHTENMLLEWFYSCWSLWKRDFTSASL